MSRRAPTALFASPVQPSGEFRAARTSSAFAEPLDIAVFGCALRRETHLAGDRFSL